MNDVKEYIDAYLNPAKVNFFNKSRDNFAKVKCISVVLIELDIKDEDYEVALSIPDNNDFKLHLTRPTKSCFVNNYFVVG